MAAGLRPQTIAKLKARAADPATRTDLAAMGARSIGADEVLGAQQTAFSELGQILQDPRTHLGRLARGLGRENCLGSGSHCRALSRKVTKKRLRKLERLRRQCTQPPR